MVQAAEHGRAVDLGGWLLAQGHVLEDEAVPAEDGGPEQIEEELGPGHGAGTVAERRFWP